MNFVPKKSALEVDKIRMDERAAGRLPSCPGGEGAGAEGAVEDTDEEVPHPVATGEEKELARRHAVVGEELRPPVAEVALPFTVIVNFDKVLGLANAALLQNGVRHLLALHRLHELGG
jgi:hypothetical protein